MSSNSFCSYTRQDYDLWMSQSIESKQFQACGVYFSAQYIRTIGLQKISRALSLRGYNRWDYW